MSFLYLQQHLLSLSNLIHSGKILRPKIQLSTSPFFISSSLPFCISGSLRSLQGSMDNEDHFPHITDHVLAGAISHLPFSEAVRTDVVSRHWTDKWKYVPRIIFDDTLAQDLYGDQPNINEAINSVLRDHTAAVEEFCFTISAGQSYRRIPELLKNFAGRNPCSMKKITLSCPERLSLNMELAPFTRLTELELDRCDLDDERLFEGGALGQLKVLSLGSITALRLRKILSACPALISLTLHKQPPIMQAWEIDSVKFGDLVRLLPNLRIWIISNHYTDLFVAAGGLPSRGIYRFLETLKLGVNVDRQENARWVFSLLNAAPNLKTLYVRFVDGNEDNDQKLGSKEYLDSLIDLELSLTGFDVCNMTDVPDNPDAVKVQLTFIRAILKNTPKLKKANVVSGLHGLANDASMYLALLSMTRASPTAALFSNPLGYRHLP